MEHKGRCHCGALEVRLETPRLPSDQILGSCQCSFCRKHNVRAFSDPRSCVTITVREPDHLQLYSFGLKTAQQVICRKCGVYFAMILIEGDEAWSVINIDALDDREQFIRPTQNRSYDGETVISRTERRKSRWCPTSMVGWPAKA